MFAVLELDNELQFMDNMLGLKGKVKGWGHEHIREILPDFFYRELVALWNEFLRRKYGSQERLLSAWGRMDEGESLDEGTVDLQPCYANADKYPKERGEDIVKFYRQLFWKAASEFVSLIRELGCKVPVILHTIASIHGLHIAYSNSPGDAISYGNYWMQFADEPRIKRRPPLRYPWYTFIEGGPGFPFLHPYRQEGKPLLLYEINCQRTDKFRAEFPLLHAVCASWADLDGVFFYIWDYGFSRDEKRLPKDHLYYPTMDHPPHGYILYSDEVFLATCLTAGKIFLHGYLKPPERPTVVRYGREDLDNIRQQWYGVLHRIYATALKHGLSIAFDPSSERTRIEGEALEAEGLRKWSLDKRL
ncbi:TPA: hypothetical protein EYP38_02255, partial [Candidatus Micrarchaeota archaeon]|nr:hypothetical protein [Candidatus Micrarchaeota archaeon]